MKKSYSVLTLALSGLLASCGGGGEGASYTPSSPVTKSTTSSTTTTTSRNTYVNTYTVPKADLVIPNNTVSLSSASVTSITLNSSSVPTRASTNLTFNNSTSLASLFRESASPEPNQPSIPTQSYVSYNKLGAKTSGSSDPKYTHPALDQSKAGLSEADSIQYYTKSNYYAGKKASNHVVDAQQGMTNVYRPTNLILSTANDLYVPYNFVAEPIRTNYMGMAGLTGKGIKFAMVDGRVNPNILSFSANNRPVRISAEVDEKNIIGYDADRVSGTLEHGSRVASIMIGMRSRINSGYAPSASLKYYELPGSELDFKKVYQVVSAANPDVVNNSYTPDTADVAFTGTSKNATSVKSAQERKKALNSTQKTSFVEAITDLAKKDNAPLLVFAAGNVNNALKDFHKFLQRDGAVDLTDTNKRAEFNKKVDNLKITDGIEISATNAFSVAHDISEKNADILLFVTGVSMDSKNNNQIKFDKTKEKLKTTNLQSIKVNDKEPASDTDWDNEFKSVLDEAGRSIADWKSYDTKYDPNNIVTSISSVKCGYLKYSCLAASFFYHIGRENNLEPVNIIHGTSFSAPMVSGIAGLLKEQFPWMTAKQLKTTLLTTATDLGEPGVDEVYGWGLVNAYQALRGPAQFIAGDFSAKLSGNKNYYFQQDITGANGLRLETPAKNDRSILYLTGNNTYQGATVINKGASLAIVSPSLLKIGSATTAGVSSKVYNDRGYLYAAKAKFGSDLYNNGFLYLIGSQIEGNLASYKGSVTALDARYTTVVKGKAEFATGSEVMVTKLTDYFPVGSSRHKDQYATLLTAEAGITTNFTSYSLVNNSLRNIDLFTDEEKKKLYVAVTERTVAEAAVTLDSTTSTSADKAAISTGANYLEAVFASAETQTDSVSKAAVATSEAPEATAIVAASPSETSSATSIQLASGTEFADLNSGQSNSVSLANSIANASAEQVATAYLQAGATSYSHSLQAQHLLASSNHAKFSQALADYSANAAQVYLQPLAGKQHWSQSNSKISGDYSYQGVSLGYLTALSAEHSLALGFSTAKADFSQSYAFTNSGKDRSKNNSVQVLAGYSYKLTEKDLWLVGISGDFTNYKVSRQFLNQGSLSSKFNSQAYSLSFAQQHNFNLGDKLSLKAGAGLVASRVNIGAITETSEPALAALRVEKAAYSRNLVALQLWAKINYQQSFGEFNAGLRFKQNLSNSNFSTASFAQSLSPKFLASLSLHQKLALVDNFALELGFNYDLSNSRRNYQVETKLSYQF